MEGTKTFYTAEDLSQILDRSENFCYKLIRELNAELKEKGYVTIRGRIPRKYFERRVLGEE